VIGWLQHNLTCDGMDAVIVIAAATVAVNLTLLVAWALFGG